MSSGVSRLRHGMLPVHTCTQDGLLFTSASGDYIYIIIWVKILVGTKIEKKSPPEKIRSSSSLHMSIFIKDRPDGARHLKKNLNYNLKINSANEFIVNKCL